MQYVWGLAGVIFLTGGRWGGALVALRRNVTPKKVSQSIGRKKDTEVGVLMGLRGKMTPKKVSRELLRKKGHRQGNASLYHFGSRKAFAGVLSFSERETTPDFLEKEGVAKLVESNGTPR